jgi:ribonuclease D
VQYAWEDVYYQPPLHADLQAALEATGRLAWFREEMDARMARRVSPPRCKEMPR